MAIDCLQSCRYTLSKITYDCAEYLCAREQWGVHSATGMKEVNVAAWIPTEESRSWWEGGLGGMIQENKVLCCHYFFTFRFLLVSH